MIADAAQVAGGKLFVLGGAFDVIAARAIPTTHRNWAIALVAEVGPGERHRDIVIDISLVDEDEEPVGLDFQAQIRVGAPAVLRPGDVSIVPMAIPLPDVTFPAAKGYAFRVARDGEELARIRFRVQPAE